MSITLLVKYISVDEHPLPHRRVRSLHGQTGQLSWEHSLKQAMDNISKEHFRYYFLLDGLAVLIVVAERTDGEPYLKALKDEETPDALLQIPRFNPKLSPIPTTHERNATRSVRQEDQNYHVGGS